MSKLIIEGCERKGFLVSFSVDQTELKRGCEGCTVRRFPQKLCTTMNLTGKASIHVPDYLSHKPISDIYPDATCSISKLKLTVLDLLYEEYKELNLL